MKRIILMAILLASGPVLAQSTNITGIPEEATVFTIQFKPGKSPVEGDVVYGAIRMRGEYLAGEYPSDLSDIPTNIDIVSDSPALAYGAPQVPVAFSVLPSNLAEAPQPESTSHRKARYSNEGFDIVTGSDGADILVKREAVSRAERLRELEERRDAENRDWIAQYETSVSTAEASPEEPGFFQLWGAHLGLGVVTVLILEGVAKFCFLDD